ncbi:MAG: IPT/TIG domain-containing protein [Anaeromyxobacter sp.]
MWITMRPTGSLTLLFLAACAGGCSRDLGVPGASPPGISTVAVVGLETRALASKLPVLAGERVAVSGSGFPDAKEQVQVQVQVGGEAAKVVSTSPTRLVLEVPVLGATGEVDLTVTTSAGFGTLAKALRYDGPGLPRGTSVSDLETAIGLAGVVPVEPGNATTGFADVAVAFGGGDSALLVYPNAGVAASTIPLGLLPGSVAARMTASGPNYLVEVLALDDRGKVGLGQVTISAGGAIVSRSEQRTLTSPITPKDCRSPRVLFTKLGTPVGAWVRGTDSAPLIATIDLGAAGTQYAPKGGLVRPTGDEVSGWATWKGDLVVYAAGNDVFLYDAGTQAAPAPLSILGQSVKARLLAGCAAGAIDSVHTVALATSPGAEALAVGYRSGGLERVALVDLITGAVHRGISGLPASALALAPVAPYSGVGGWYVLAAAGGNLVRFSTVPNGTACGEDLAPDASLPLSSNAFAALPGFAAMAPFTGGTRVLSVTPSGDLVTVLPPTLSSPGAVFRFASYGRVSTTIAPVSIGGADTFVTLAVAEHTSVSSTSALLDTGSAELVLALDAGDRPLALGGSGFGRGAVWVRNPTAGQSWDGALAYSGDLPRNLDTSSAGKLQGASAAVTSFKMDTTCSLRPEMEIVGSAPLAGNPDLVAQGPARSGQLGPDGYARYGPTTVPTYLVSGSTLTAIGLSSADACLSPVGGLDALACTGTAKDLGVAPVDLTLSAGDASAAARSLSTTCRPCKLPFSCAGTGPAAACADGDVLCRRAFCPVAPSLRVVPLTASGAAHDVPLPSAPVAATADRAGGFLVTLPCAAAGAGFPAPFDALCPKADADAGTVGALVFVPEDGATPTFLAVLPGLAGAVAVTPNGAEAWVSGPVRSGALHLTRLALPRDPDTGSLDLTRRATLAGVQPLGTAGEAVGGYAASGITFTPDGATAVVTVPADYRILLLE